MLNWPRICNALVLRICLHVCMLNGTAFDCSLIIRDFKSNGRKSVCALLMIFL